MKKTLLTALTAGSLFLNSYANAQNLENLIVNPTQTNIVTVNPTPSQSATETQTISQTPTATLTQQPTQVQTANLKQKERTTVPFIVIHGIADNPNKTKITTKRFEEILTYLNDSGFVPSSLDEVFDKKADIPVGKKPVVIECDDMIFNKEALDIFYNFSKSHPGFRMRMAFFTNINAGDFNYFGLKSEKALKTILDYYSRAGIEIQSHGANHIRMDLATPDEAKKDIESLNNLLMKYGVKKPEYFSYPYGAIPNKKVMEIIRQNFRAGFSYRGNSEIYKKGHNLYKTARIDASNFIELKEYFKKHKNDFYIKEK